MVHAIDYIFCWDLLVSAVLNPTFVFLYSILSRPCSGIYVILLLLGLSLSLILELDSIGCLHSGQTYLLTEYQWWVKVYCLERHKFPGTRIVRYSSILKVLQAISVGSCDMFVHIGCGLQNLPKTLCQGWNIWKWHRKSYIWLFFSLNLVWTLEGIENQHETTVAPTHHRHEWLWKCLNCWRHIIWLACFNDRDHGNTD